MKYPLFLLRVALMISIGATFLQAETVIPESLRAGIKTNQQTIDLALAMQADGWEYIMPRPKSNQARWGNTDGRTTWWVGRWINQKTNQTSSLTPQLKNGVYIGDGNGSSGWRRGGSPPWPSELQWLLSKSGGVKPN